MKEIQLTQGKVALVDDEDYERINQFKWYANKNSKDVFYACTGIWINGKINIYKMHWFIDGKIWKDHKDRNGLNNQKDNLRQCNNSNNQMNKIKSVNKSSIYKGVSFIKRINKWEVKIQINGKPKLVGRYYDEIIAAKKYDEMAIINHGEFARLNFPTQCAL